MNHELEQFWGNVTEEELESLEYEFNLHHADKFLDDDLENAFDSWCENLTIEEIKSIIF